MTGLVRKATLLTACGCLVAGAAMAGIPDPANSLLGTGINLGASNNVGTVDVRVEKNVTIRDAFNNPIQNSTVVITFTSCTNQDLRLCNDQPHHPGLFNCAAKTVTAVTNASGVATFRIKGGAASGPGNPAGAGSPGCATVQADGVPMGNLLVGAFDNNNTGGVNAADLSNWLGDRNGYIANVANYRSRSDFDGSASVTPADGSAILSASSSPASDFSCASTCL